MARHCSGRGALTDAACQTRWQILNDAIREAVICEYARWGDTRAEAYGEPLRHRDLTWEPEVQRVLAMMQGNTARFIEALRRAGYYPPFDPPVAGADGTIRDPAANPGAHRILVTPDGSDPRLPGGAIAPAAVEARGLSPTGVVLARIHDPATGEWSALARLTLE